MKFCYNCNPSPNPFLKALEGISSQLVQYSVAFAKMFKDVQTGGDLSLIIILTAFTQFYAHSFIISMTI